MPELLQEDDGSCTSSVRIQALDRRYTDTHNAGYFIGRVSAWLILETMRHTREVVSKIGLLASRGKSV